MNIISFYNSKELSIINQQLTTIYVIPLNNSENLKFDRKDGGHPWKLIRNVHVMAIFSCKIETSFTDNLKPFMNLHLKGDIQSSKAPMPHLVLGFVKKPQYQ